MSGQVVVTFDTGNTAFHDAQLDYYGKRAAAACGTPQVPAEDAQGKTETNSVVSIWDITDNQQRLIAQLQGHEGPVWKVAWAHPKFGSLLATCSYDMKVIIWKEINGQWQKAYVDSSHTASVNDIAFCPWEHGLRLACASSDGTVSVLTYSPTEAQWRRSDFKAHACGVNSVSWSPAVQREGGLSMRLASGGCDNNVCIWKCENDMWSQEMPQLMPSHTNWVRQVAWRPDTSSSVVASGSWDKTVTIWKQEIEGQPWRQVTSIPVEAKVESVAWSVTGSLLAIASDDGEASIYKEGYDGRYEKVSSCSEQGYTDLSKPACASPGGYEMGNGVAAAASPTMGLNAELEARQQSVLDAFGPLA